MTPLLISILCLAMVGTSFLSGIFGMAGGMILVGILLAIMPVPEAMMLHGVTQMASNGWRGLLWWRHVRWSAVGSYVFGCAIALGCGRSRATCRARRSRCCCSGSRRSWSGWRRRTTGRIPRACVRAAIYGIACMTLILLTGVAGPLIDQFFLGGKLDRREIVATKAICQIFGHAAKLIYFGSLIDQTASVDPIVAVLAIVSSMIGTTLAKRVLEAMTRPAVPPLGQRHHHGDRRILRGPRHGPGRARPRLRALSAGRVIVGAR